jgi:nitrogen fixation NifU-like protein
VSSLDQLYQQVILDHARERHGAGLRATSEGLHGGQSHQYNPLCGDEVTLRVAVTDTGTVQDVSWEGDGCSISQAAISVLYDLVVGEPLPQALVTVRHYREMVRSRGQSEPDEDVLGDAVAFAGVGRHANRVKCAMLGWTAFEDAVVRTGVAPQRKAESDD